MHVGVVLQWNLKKWDGGMWIGFMWVTVDASGRLL
jgi:hypothetical protein